MHAVSPAFQGTVDKLETELPVRELGNEEAVSKPDRQQTTDGQTTDKTPASVELWSVVWASVVCCLTSFETSSEFPGVALAPALARNSPKEAPRGGWLG